MIMAAGLGTRLRPFTERTAKPVLPLLGVPMIQFSLDALKHFGIHKVVINVHHLAGNTAQAVRFLEGPQVREISDESTLLLGSAGGLAHALPKLDHDPFFLLNADTLAHVNLKDLKDRHLKLKHEFGVKLTLAVFSKGPAGEKYRQIIVDPKRGLIRGLGDPTFQKPFYSGVAIIEPEALSGVSSLEPSDFVPKILEPAILTGKAGAYCIDNSLEPTPYSWFDIGSPELWYKTHLQLIKLYEEEELPTLWKKRIEKANLRLAPEIWVSKRSRITELPNNWKGPLYFDRYNDSSNVIPNLQPGSILYGAVTPQAGAVPGIGYESIFREISR